MPPQSRKSRKAQQEERRRMEAIRDAEHRKQRRSNLAVIGGSVTVAILIVAGAGITIYQRDHKSAPVSQTSASPAAPTTAEGKTVAVTALTATTSVTSPISGATVYAAPKDVVAAGPITYGNTPPVGGAHSATFLNCGTYSAAVPNEFAVTDLEHGAVWITYNATVTAKQIAGLAKLVRSYGGPYSYVDLSPYTGQTSPVTVTAWGVQLTVTSPTDPRIKSFIAKYRKSSSAPKPSGTCGPTGGTGSPAGTIVITPTATPSPSAS